MHKQALFALAHPVYDPQTDIVIGHYWLVEPDTSACLTVNIGAE